MSISELVNFDRRSQETLFFHRKTGDVSSMGYRLKVPENMAIPNESLKLWSPNTGLAEEYLVEDSKPEIIGKISVEFYNPLSKDYEGKLILCSNKDILELYLNEKRSSSKLDHRGMLIQPLIYDS
jgi:hypothetical protein